jgi:hypothetical protein
MNGHAPPTIESHGGTLRPVADGFSPLFFEDLWIAPVAAAVLAVVVLLLWRIPQLRGKSTTVTAFAIRAGLIAAGLLMLLMVGLAVAVRL